MRQLRRPHASVASRSTVLETDDECIGCEPGAKAEDACLTEPSFQHVFWCCVCVHVGML